MNRWRRSAAALITSGGLLFALAACGTSITVNGADIADPESALSGALTQLKTDNDAGIQNGSITISDATSCFYVKPSVESEDVSEYVACGPIRRLGQPDDKVWDSYSLKFNQNADGEVTAAVEGQGDQAMSLNTELLVSTDDTEPAAVSEVPAPQAPPTTITDSALLTSSADGLGSFTALEKPAKLITPAATIEVTEAAQPEFVPKEMVEGSDDPSGTAPYYRPAEGQKLYAFKVKIGPSPESGSALESTSASESVVDLATQLTVGLSGGASVNIASKVDGIGAAETATLECASESVDDEFPCAGGETTEAILLMTVPAERAPSLVATVNGDAQSVDLSTGELTSSVSRVEYDRSELSADIGKTLSAGPLKMKSGSSDYTADWSVSLKSVSLSAFDAHRGWAPEGRAWMVLGTDGIDMGGNVFAFETDESKTLTVEVDGETIAPDGLNDDELGWGDPINWAYQIPEDAQAVTVVFKPTGTLKPVSKTVDYTVDQAVTHQLSLPK